MAPGAFHHSTGPFRVGLVLTTLALVAACSGTDVDPEVAGTQMERDTSSTAPTTAVPTTPAPTTTVPTTTSTTTAMPTTNPPTTEPAMDGPLVHPSSSPALAGTPEDLARQVTEAERTVRSDAATTQQLADAAHLLQIAYRRLSHLPEWDASVFGAVPPDLHHAVLANVAARREFLGMYTRERHELPAWRIVAPPPVEELLGHYRAAEAAHGVPWQYLAAIHLVETAMGRVDGVSSAGALGPMQFMPGTWDAFGEGDVFAPRDAIMAAARYLAHNGAPHDMDSALFNYNRHRNYVRAVQHYASVMAADPLAHRGFHHWQVYVQTSAGDVLLPVGYDEARPVPAAEYLARGS